MTLIPTPTMLSERQLQILQCAADGDNLAETGKKLYIEVNTVKQHRKQILLATRARTITQAVAICFVDGQLPYSWPAE